MKKTIKSWMLIGIILALSLTVIGSPDVLGATASGDNVYNLQLFDNDQVLNSPINKAKYWFELSPGVKLSGNCFLELWYSHSETLLYDESLMTVLLNGLPLDSKRLSQVDTNTAVWRVPIPIERLQAGSNEIDIISRQRTILGLCRDIDNDANWIVILNKSFFHFETLVPNVAKLNNYPYPFLNYLSNQPINCTWYLPNNSNSAEIQAMLQLASDWGWRERFSTLPIQVQLGMPKTGDENQLLIGELKHWPGLIKNDLPKGRGILSLVSSGDKGNQLLISGSDTLGLSKAQTLLSIPEMVNQINSNSCLIKDMPQKPISTMPVGRPGLYTFSELGYQNFQFIGAFHQRDSLIIRRPLRWSIAGSSYIEIHFRHAVNLDPHRSTIAVAINGVPVASAALNAENADHGILRVKIPAEERDKAEWLIEFSLYHYIGTVDCSKRYDETAWSVITGDSFVNLVADNFAVSPSLSNFPFIDNGLKESRFNATIWLSSNPTEEELNLTAIIAARAAQISRLPIDWQVVMGDSPQPKSLFKKNPVIMIGYKKEIKRLMKLKGRLPLLPDGKGGYNFSPSFNLLPEGLEEAACFETAVSPWNSKSVLYTILGADDASLARSSRILSNLNLANQIYGQLSIITSDYRIISLSAINKEQLKGRTWAQFLSFNDHNIFVVYIIVIFLVIVGIVCMLWLVYKRSK